MPLCAKSAPPLNRSAAALLVLLCCTSCARIDHAQDVDRAAALVGASTSWRPDWNAPWSTDADDGWDGASPLGEGLAVTLALRHNLAIRADLETIAAARADLVQSRLLPNPVLSLAFGIPIAGTDGGTQVTIGAMQQLASLWLRPHRSAAADARLRGAVLSVSDRALTLVADTRTAHARAASAEHALVLQREHAAILDRRLALARASADAGEASLAAVNGAEMRLAESRRGVLEREHALAIAKRDLLALMGRAAAGAGFTAATDASASVVAASPAAMPPFPDEPAIIPLVAQQRLDVAAALAARDGAGAQLREAGLAGLPELDAGAMYEREMDGDKMLGPSIAVEVPIFDDGSAAKARAAAEARRADLHARAVLQGAIREARAAHHGYTTAAAAGALARGSILPAALRTLAFTQQLYDAGEANLGDVLDAQLIAVEAELGVVDDDLAVAVALIALERAVGGRLPLSPKPPPLSPAAVSPAH